MKKICVLASGAGTNLEAILKAAAAGKISGQVVLVISDREEAKALERARKRKIETLFLNPKDYKTRLDYDLALKEAINKAGADLVVLAGFMRFLSKEFVESFPNKIVNIHPSLLPAFPGVNSVAEALDYGVKVTGCTVHFVDEGMDTGPIILQEAVPVIKSDTAQTLLERIHAKEYRLYPHAIDLFCRGKLKIIGRRCEIAE